MTEQATERPCAACGKPAVPHGRFCPECYGGVLHPDGKPMSPNRNGDQWMEFNAEADAWLLDEQMPPADQVLGVIQHNVTRRWRLIEAGVKCDSASDLPFDEGYAAAAAGVSSHANPYEEHSWKHNEWWLGWDSRMEFKNP